MDYLDEIKKVSFDVFLIIGTLTISLYVYKITNPYSFIGPEERFLAATILFGFISIVSNIKEILTRIRTLKNKTNYTTNAHNIKKKIFLPEITTTTLKIPTINISYIIYFLLILATSFVIIFFSSKILLQLKDLIPYFILIYFVISLILKLDSRISIASALLLLFLTAITLVQGLENAANQIAIYAYYFLVAGVVLQLVEYIRNPEKEC